MPVFLERNEQRIEQQDVRLVPYVRNHLSLNSGDQEHLNYPWLHFVYSLTGFLKLNAQPLLVNGHSYTTGGRINWSHFSEAIFYNIM